MLFEFIATIVFLVIIWFILDNRENPYAPPGPFNVPLLGNLIQIGKADKRPYIAFHKLSEQYGPVMSLKIGFSNSVIISSFEAMKSILGGEDAAGRDLMDLVKERCDNKNLGLIFSSGEVWRKMRSYSIATLKEYGYGKRNSMEDLIADELQDLRKHLKSLMQENEGIVDFHLFFNPSVISILWTIIAGRKLSYSDKKIKYLLESTEVIKKATVFGAGLLAAFPFLKSVAPEATGYNLHKEIFKNWRIFFQDLLDEYREVYKKTKTVNCFIDSFVQKIEENSHDPKTHFTDEQFVMTVMDLFHAGEGTTSENVAFAFLFMILRPDVQEKIQNEIDTIVGSGRQPQLDDRTRMPYTQAVMLEVFRWARVTVTSVPRKAMKNISYKKWTIKKGTVIITNSHSIHFDEDFWGDPHQFRPERFLSETGKIIAEKAERIVVFGYGKRACPGETLGRDTFFLYLTTLLQTFTFEMVPGDEKPSTEPRLGFVLAPFPYRALVKERRPLL